MDDTLSVVVLPVINKLPETVKSPVIVPPSFGSAALAVLYAKLACANDEFALSYAELA